MRRPSRHLRTLKKSDTDKAEMAASNKTEMQTADLYSVSGCYPPYPCPQGSYNSLYTNPTLPNGPYPNPSVIGNPGQFLGWPYYPAGYLFQGYPNRYNMYRNTFRYPRYPTRYGQYHHGQYH